MHVIRYAVAPSVDKNDTPVFFFQLKKQKYGVKKNCHGFCSLPSPCTPPRLCLWPLGYLRIKTVRNARATSSGAPPQVRGLPAPKKQAINDFLRALFFCCLAAVRHLLSPCRPWPIILPSASLQANTKVPAAFAPPSLRPPQKA
jgi:hypothetical protein